MPTFQCVYCGADVKHKDVRCGYCNNHQPMHPAADNYETPCGVRKDFKEVFLVDGSMNILRCTDIEVRENSDGPIKDFVNIHMGHGVVHSIVFWPHRAGKTHRMYFSYGEACRNIQRISEGLADYFAGAASYQADIAKKAFQQELPLIDIPEPYVEEDTTQ